MDDKRIYFYEDNSSLYRAWTKYYSDMELAYNKLQKKVYQRVLKRKFPNK
jgi:archaellum component FlaF (FlaF/FlaG flagellin family)